MSVNNNFLVDHTFYGCRKSVSMDVVLFRLFSVLMKGDVYAKKAIRCYMEESWGKTGLSRSIQRRVLAEVCRPSLVTKVYGTDKYLQNEIEL